MKLTPPKVLAVLALAACTTPPVASPSTPKPSASVSPAPAADDVPTTPASSSASEAPPAPAAQGSARAQHPEPDTSGTPRARLMRSHFRDAALIRKAVIDGVIADAVAPADALAKIEGLGKIEPAWQSSIDVLQYAARRIQHGSDIPATAAAVADIGIACGACHKAAGGPHLKVDAPPTGDGSLESRMRRHVWATERLWEGIFVPSDASWNAGADALVGDPFPKEILDRGGVHARSASAQFRSLVSTVAAKKTPEERGQVYASLLATCSACHAATWQK